MDPLSSSEPGAAGRRRAGHGRRAAEALSPVVLGLAGSFFEVTFSRGYEGPPDYDAAELERLVSITEKTPVAFLFSHRSHLDGMAMYSMLHRERLPPSHLVGGDNMA